MLVEDRNQVALVYFKSEDAYLARQRNEGFIRVDQAENISVIGEHLGHKNAFVVKTPKAMYHLLPESRCVVCVVCCMSAHATDCTIVRERERERESIELKMYVCLEFQLFWYVLDNLLKY